MKPTRKSRRGAIAVHRPPPRRGFLGWGASAAMHLIVIAALFELAAIKPLPEPSAIPVSLVQIPQPKPDALPGPSGAAGPPQESKSAPQPAVQPVPRPAAHVRAGPTPAPVETAVDDFSDTLSDADLAGAAQAGEGGARGGGGACDLAGSVQQALRRDPLVHSAVADAHRLGKAVMLWNGDWVRSGNQDGKGLSAVREAIQWELAFAPAACRNRPMHGLVLLSLADGGTRFAIGAGAWRWSDLLGLPG